VLPVLAIDPYGLLARLIKKEREKRNSRGIKCGNMGQFLVFLFVIYEILTLDEYV
jgi:p-aminobenzoyl-glutamate transporter AbgT